MRALDDVSLTLERGEVLAVVGENGAGKSTLMRIVAGVESPDEGEILVDGQAVRFTSVAQALKLGISLIHQELNLADNLTIGANIFLGREPQRFGLIDQATMDRESRKYLDMVGLDIPPQTIVSTLSIGKQQLVEIAKALSTNARLIIMDEPTSSLSEHEAQKLFEVVRRAARRAASASSTSRTGWAKWSNWPTACVVLRDGQCTGELSREQNPAQEHGAADDRPRRVAVLSAHAAHARRRSACRSTGSARRPFRSTRSSFSLRAGEVVGLAGLVGAGRSELLTRCSASRPPLAGR